MSPFQGVVLTPLTFTPSNTPTSAKKSNKESLASITVPSMSKIDAMSTTSRAQSPTYIPSSRSPSPIPVPSRHTVTNNPISPRSAANILDSGTYLNPDTLQGIAKALLKTIKQRESNHAAEVQELNAQIARLEDLVKTHTDTFQHCPEGYCMSSTPNTWGSPLTSAMAYNERSNGLSTWNRVPWPVSPKTTAPETPPTSSKFTPNLALQWN